MQETIEDFIKENLRYEPETGYLYWTKRRPGRQINKPVGSPNATGHLTFGFLLNGRKQGLLVHRVIFFLMMGYWPTTVDHINRNPNDNRWSNLREATWSQQMRNRVVRGRKYPPGVYATDSGKFRTALKINGKQIHIGLYETVEEAQHAWQACAEYHGLAEYLPCD